MAATESSMLPLGTQMPHFALPNMNGNDVNSDDLKDSKGVMVAFISNHCPFVKHVIKGLSALGNEYQEKGIQMITICSNDIDNYPQDGPELMKYFAAEHHLQFPYLFDETQEVARSFNAECTPDFFLFNADHQLVYRGQFDTSRPSNGIPVTGADLKRAMDQLLQGQPIFHDQKPSIGCNIKWKPGREYDY